MPAVLALVVLVLGALIFHDVISPPTPAPAPAAPPQEGFNAPQAGGNLPNAQGGQPLANAPGARDNSFPPRGFGAPACITLQNQVQTDLNRQASDQLAGQRQLNQAQNA